MQQVVTDLAFCRRSSGLNHRYGPTARLDDPTDALNLRRGSIYFFLVGFGSSVPIQSKARSNHEVSSVVSARSSAGTDT